MNAYISDALPIDDVTDGLIRTYPWTENESYAADKYYDFKANPTLIPQALNSFKGWADWSEWEGVQLFYRLLEWLNGPASRLESNGCGFLGPHENPQKDLWPGELLTTGGLIFLFRDIELNLSEQSAAWAALTMPDDGALPPLAPSKNISWLLRRCHEYLQQLNPEFISGCVSVILFPTFYSELPLKRNDKFGHQVAFQWWVWGDTEKETMAHFREVVAAMFECLKRVSAEAETAIEKLRLELKTR
ncbi:MAG TPA: hypothetical protein VF791_24520 [Pyrinomonadaceae bacterium]